MKKEEIIKLFKAYIALQQRLNKQSESITIHNIMESSDIKIEMKIGEFERTYIAEPICRRANEGKLVGVVDTYTSMADIAEVRIIENKIINL